MKKVNFLGAGYSINIKKYDEAKAWQEAGALDA